MRIVSIWRWGDRVAGQPSEGWTGQGRSLLAAQKSDLESGCPFPSETPDERGALPRSHVCPKTEYSVSIAEPSSVWRLTKAKVKKSR